MSYKCFDSTMVPRPPVPRLLVSVSHVSRSVSQLYKDSGKLCPLSGLPCMVPFASH